MQQTQKVKIAAKIKHFPKVKFEEVKNGGVPIRKCYEKNLEINQK